MSPTPEEIEEAKEASRRIVGFTADHYEQLIESQQFTREEAFELVLQYHWAMLKGGEDE